MTRTTSDVSALRAAMNGLALEPGDEGYDEARNVWNGSIDRHPAIIARLGEGKTASDAFQGLVAGVRGGGVITTIAGLEGEGKGQTAYVTITMPAGDYIFFCGLPDTATGKTHAVLGMISGFTVR